MDRTVLKQIARRLSPQTRVCQFWPKGTPLPDGSMITDLGNNAVKPEDLAGHEIRWEWWDVVPGGLRRFGTIVKKGN